MSIALALRSIIIPDSVISIWDTAFSACENLAGVTIGKGLKSVGRNPFIACVSLSQITVSPDNPSLSVIDGALISGSEMRLICYPTGLAETSYQVPNGILSIGGAAFFACARLKSIALPEGTITIGENAFANCMGLASLDIPDSVTSIGSGAFSSCGRLTGLTIPEGIAEIKDETFARCVSLKNIVLPDSVTIIGALRFSVRSPFQPVHSGWGDQHTRLSTS